MSWLTDLLQIYGRVFRRALELLGRNWLLAVMVLGYQGIMAATGALLMPFLIGGGPIGGVVGSVVVMLVWTACASSFLALLGQVVRNGRMAATDVRDSFLLHFSDLLNVAFLLFGLQLVGGLVLGASPYLVIVFGMAIGVFLNAVPEMLYLGHHAGPALFAESYRFIGQYWIEWFPATILLSMASLGALRVVPAGPFGLFAWVVIAVMLSYAFLVRGLLFLELTGSSRRAREFQRRAGS